MRTVLRTLCGCEQEYRGDVSGDLIKVPVRTGSVRMGWSELEGSDLSSLMRTFKVRMFRFHERITSRTYGTTEVYLEVPES
jgi:hypothetical protein